MTRVIERRFVLGEPEKKKFRDLMRRVEGFCGVKIMTYAILSNHVHILLHVPERKGVNDAELIKRMMLLYDKTMVKEFGARLKELREEEKSEDTLVARAAAKTAADMRKPYIVRMYDLSEFMKTMKQRYTMWYNANHGGRRGTLWEDRFKSVLVQDSEYAIVNMAAYIDLNAVRAGIVSDPKDYRYCGYGEAMGGNRKARKGINSVLLSLSYDAGWKLTRAQYRKLLYMKGQAGAGPDGKGRTPGFSYDQVQEVLDKGGKLSQSELLRCRVRYFTDGVAFGSREFVESVFERHKENHSLKRKTGARKPRVYGALDGLFSMRDLRLAAVSVPEQKDAA